MAQGFVTRPFLERKIEDPRGVPAAQQNNNQNQNQGMPGRNFAAFGIGLLPGLLSLLASPQQSQNFGDKLKNFFIGGDESQFDPDQLKVLEYLLSNGQQNLENPYQGFEGIQNDIEQQFQQQTVPRLAERFTSMGGRGSGALSSPAFASQLGQAGAQLNTGIGALKAQFGQQNQQQALKQIGMGLQPKTQFRPGLLQNIAPYAAKAGMDALGGL